MKKYKIWFLAGLIFSIVLSSPGLSIQAAAKKPKLNVKKLNMTVNSSFYLRIYNLKKKQEVTFTSTNEKVVLVRNVTKKGKRAKITAASVGSCTIKAVVRKGTKVVRRLKCKVKVTPTAVSIKFPKRVIHMEPLDQFDLEPIIKPNSSTEQPLFESDNPLVATVNSRGVVTAQSTGEATITATLLSSGAVATCTIKVNNVPEEELD